MSNSTQVTSVVPPTRQYNKGGLISKAFFSSHLHKKLSTNTEENFLDHFFIDEKKLGIPFEISPSLQTAALRYLFSCDSDSFLFLPFLETSNSFSIFNSYRLKRFTNLRRQLN